MFVLSDLLAFQHLIVIVSQLFYPILVQGIIGTGATFLGTNPAYTPYELEHTLRISKAKYIITDPELLKAPKAAAKAVGIPASAKVQR